MSYETNKQRWKRDKTVDYICVEARPARKSLKESGCQVTVDFVPPESYGACKAFQELQRAILQHKTPEQAREFYEHLYAFSSRALWMDQK